MKSTTIFLCVGVFELICFPTLAAKPSAQNMEFYNEPKKIERIALAIDVLITADIAGKVNGIYRSDYSTLMPIISEATKEEIEEHGFLVNELHANAGLFAPADLKLVYAENNKSTGEEVHFPFYDSNPPSWSGQPLQALMNDAIIAAKTRKGESYAKVSVPDELKKLPIDAIVILNISSIDVPMSKSLGIALATGIASAGIAGSVGSPVYSYMMVNSGGSAMLTVIDLRDGTILWHEIGARPGKGSSGGTAQIRPIVARLLGGLPFRNGKPHLVKQPHETQEADASSEDDSVDAADKAAEPTKAAENAAEPKFGTPPKPTIFADPAGWKLSDARRAYLAREISAPDYRAFQRQCKLDYREARKKLDQARREKVITSHEQDMKELELQWLYRGF